MSKIKIGLFILTFLVVGVILKYETRKGIVKELKSQESSIDQCTDTDNGHNVFVKGTATGIIINGNTKKSVALTDYCDSNGLLAEFDCSNINNSLPFNYIKCLYGCEDGRCLDLGEKTSEKFTKKTNLYSNVNN